ncbi:YceI family protein [Pseudemcibacter sp.]|uniref:YceI family protein n=1 Tax=Pseudemcibacter sp. TaxID=2943293 RepID=UPI003F69678C|nr:YceI family protein [Emcibacteraceae bacterium]
MLKLKSFIFILFLSICSISYAQEPSQCIEYYKLDKTYTSIVWYADRMRYSRTIGRFADFEGTIELNNCEINKSKIDILIDTNSIASGSDEIDRQLKSITFFDVENHPEARFQSTNINLVEKDNAEVTGNFTMLGKTREISLKVRFNKKAIDPLVNLMRTGYSIRTNVKRSKWGMDKLLAFVSDDISIVIEAEALKVN